MAIGLGILQFPRGGRFLMSEVPLYVGGRDRYRIQRDEFDLAHESPRCRRNISVEENRASRQFPTSFEPHRKIAKTIELTKVKSDPGFREMR
jgi:hypothetical protein